MQLMLALLLVMPSSLFQQAAAAGKPQGMTESAAFAQFQAEKNPEAKKKLALNFEKNYPKSRRLPDVYIELSKVLVGANEYVAARQYAEKAVSTVDKLKTQPTPPENTDKTWHDWLSTLDASARSNVTWVNQMAAWQQQQLRGLLNSGRQK
jgi:hypothetical protein